MHLDQFLLSSSTEWRKFIFYSDGIALCENPFSDGLNSICSLSPTAYFQIQYLCDFSETMQFVMKAIT